jgi:hypothetical protein
MDGSVGSEILYGILLELDYMTDSQVYFWIQSCALISDLFTVYLILCKALYSYGPMDCCEN